MGEESEFERPVDRMWKLAPDCVELLFESRDDSTEGNGSGKSSAGGGVRALCSGEALYASPPA